MFPYHTHCTLFSKYIRSSLGTAQHGSEVFRCVGNLLHCLGSKLIKRAAQRGQKPSDAAINSLKEALQAAKENSVVFDISERLPDKMPGYMSDNMS